MSFYTSLTGLNAATAQLAVTSNNIANVGTTGFKRSRADFGDIFATSPLQKASAVIGQGVALKAVTQEFSQGNVQFSASSLDIAITGDGFFPLRSADGLQDIYTRNGTFTLNDSFAVVNSAGQALLAAPVDSSGKADLDSLRKLYIPRATTGDARQTENIALALNLPADSAVITKAFDRTDPSTYNITTAVTVFDSGGNDYLATVYYAKTQVATPGDPSNKWQTHIYIGDNKLEENLIQASDTKGKPLYVNKYGEIRSETSVPPVPVERISRSVSKLYNLDDLKNPAPSVPASVASFPALTDDMIAAWKNGISGNDVELPSNGLDINALKKLAATPGDGDTFEIELGCGCATYSVTVPKQTTGGSATSWDEFAAEIASGISASAASTGYSASYSASTGLLSISGTALEDVMISRTTGQTKELLQKNAGGMKFSLQVDGSQREIDLTRIMFEDQPAQRFTGTEFASVMTNEINRQFGSQRYFDLSSLSVSGGGGGKQASSGSLWPTRLPRMRRTIATT